jgi:multiple sugar transport system substrate-binding protein
MRGISNRISNMRKNSDKVAERKKLSRRDIVRLTAAAAVVGPFVAFPDRARASQKTLKIAKWAHFVPEYDDWFEDVLAPEWGRQHDTKVVVSHIPVENIHAVAEAEVAAGKGHDVFVFPWPPAEFQKHAIDHAEIYQTVSLKFGSIARLAHRSTFNPAAKKYFAFADSWIPAPLHYYEDYWGEIGMPFGPIHYGGLRSGARELRAKLGVPCGLALAPSLESNITLHTLLYGFRSSVIDAKGEVMIGRNARTIEALKYVKALYDEAGTPDQLAWNSSGNVLAMLGRKTSCTINGIGLLRAAEKKDPGLAAKIRLSPPLLGSAGVLGFPHATNCSVVWNFADNQDGAKQFLIDLIQNSTTVYDKSQGCNFPFYQVTVPDLIVRLEKDPHGDPPYKYKDLRDALYWTRNLGFPGYANPVGMEVFNSFIIPKMFISVVKGDLSPEDAAHAAEAEVLKISDRWKQA